MKKIIFFISSILLIATACEKQEVEKDLESPKIDMTAIDASPTNCSIIQIDDTLFFKGTFTDNIELGSYAIEIHNNFDHHSHSTSSESCVLGEIKTPLSPWIFQKDYAIPEKQTKYEAYVAIKVPTNIDLGDYHFYIRVTDQAGWSTYEGISFKIIE